MNPRANRLPVARGGGAINPASVSYAGNAGSVPFVLAKWTVPIVHASSGSMGNNGALTGHTAFPRTNSGGVYLYLPANAIAAGSAAGLYWAKFSSTTAATVYNAVYTTGIPLVGTDTAFVTTGPGAYTGDTATEVGVTIAVPPLAAGTIIRITTLWEMNNTAGAKAGRIRFSGAAGTLYLSQAMASQAHVYDQRQIMCMTSAIQVGHTAGVGPFALSGSAPVTSTVDTSVATSLFLSVQHSGAATDWHMLTGGMVELILP